MKTNDIKQIPNPSSYEVKRYLSKWDSLESYVSQEQALNKLFHDVCPKNSDIRDILLKCSVLNDFYSTNIYSIFPVAKHILKLKIDNRLMDGDLSLVNDIAVIEIGGKTKTFYSFASKYCSHHNSKAYAIYDSYVEKCLVYFNKIDKFSDFRRQDLRNYKTFNKALIDFKHHYGLDEYGLKEIDQYLWQLGKEHFPNNY